MDKTFILPLFGGGGGSTKDATVTPEDLLEGVTAYGKDGKIEGTIPVKSEDDITVEERTTTIPAGYYPEEIETSVSDEYIIPEGTLLVTKSGETDVREYEKIDVPVAVAEFLHNGTYRAEDMGVLGYEQVDVNVTPNLQDKLITENGTYTAETGYDGLGTVLVNVEAEPNLQDKLITQNGVYHADAGYDGLGTVTVEAVHGDFDYLCFTAVDAGSSIWMDHYGTNATISKPLIFISTDHKETWRVWDYEPITLANVGDKVYMYGTNEQISGYGDTGNNRSQFTMNGHISATGNIQTLLTQDGSRSNVTIYGYYDLFYNCTSLVTAPKLPATRLGSYCYNNMFYGCTSLTTAPELPATTLAQNCYEAMFSGCANLRTAPELPATVLAENCYKRLFWNCTSLTTAPELPATRLVSQCYYDMFAYCRSLTTAPELPATTLADYCYYEMFRECAFTTAPELPATTLADYCYYNMFVYCRNLNSITTYANPWNTSYANSWVSGVSPTGTFFKDANATIPIGNNGIPSGWVVYDLVDGVVDLENKTITLTTNLPNATIYYTTDGTEPTTSSEVYTGPISVPEGRKYYTIKAIAANDDITLPSRIVSYNDYFYFEAIEAGSTFKISYLPSTTFEYSTDGNTWTNLSTNTITLANIGDRAYIRQSSDKGYWRDNGSINGTRFIINGSLKAGGCISTLAYKDASHDRPDMSKQYAMSMIFYNWNYEASGLTDASDLKMDFVEMTDYCYYDMFGNNFKLKIGPSILPATKLAHHCYSRMFNICSALTVAPELPATELANSCYENMFEGCRSLRVGPTLPATTTVQSCYYNMFAREFGSSNPSNLEEITIYATNVASSAFYQWISLGWDNPGILRCPAELTLPADSISGIPRGWTRVDL